MNLLLAFIFAIFVVILHFSLFYSFNLDNYAENEPIEISARVTKVVSEAPNSLSLIEITKLNNRLVPFYKTINAQISHQDSEHIFEQGDLLTLKVKLRPFRARANRHSFDTESYAFKKHLYFKGKVVEVVSHQKVQMDLRKTYKNQVWEIFKNKQLGWLYYGLTTGDKSKASNETKKQVIQLGIGHILAISGLHVGIVFLICFSMAKAIAWIVITTRSKVTLQSINLNYFYCIFGLITALIYIYLCEFPVSAVRAWLMVAIFSLIYFLKRKVSLIKTLSYSLVVILLLDPFALLEPGLYLSFVGFATVVTVLKLSSANSFMSNSLVRLCTIQIALLFTLAPLSMLYFQGVSTAGLVINLLVIPLLSLVIFPYMIICIMFDGVFKNLDYLYVDHFLSFGLKLITDNYLDVAWLAGPSLSATLVTLIYCFIVIGILPFWRRFLLIPTLALISYFFIPKPLWQVDFFDVGHGTSVLVTSENEALLYDLGAKYFDYYSLFERIILPEIHARGLDLKYTIISHPDKDHAGGIDELKLFDGFSSLSMFHNEDPFSFCELKTVQLGIVIIETLWPAHDMKSDNNNSCVVKVQGTGAKVLLTGDIESQAEQLMVQMYASALQADILLVPHHGSKTSSSSLFLDAVKPAQGIVSRNYYSAWKLPHKEVTQRYINDDIELIDTAITGQITIEFYQHGYNIKTVRDESLFWLKHRFGFN